MSDDPVTNPIAALKYYRETASEKERSQIAEMMAMPAADREELAYYITLGLYLDVTSVAGYVQELAQSLGVMQPGVMQPAASTDNQQSDTRTPPKEWTGKTPLDGNPSEALAYYIRFVPPKTLEDMTHFLAMPEVRRWQLLYLLSMVMSGALNTMLFGNDAKPEKISDRLAAKRNDA